MTPNLPQGVWSTPSGLDPNELEYMVVDPASSRALIILVRTISPFKRGVWGLWYEQIEPGLVRTRFNPADAWTISPYKMEGSNLCWCKHGEQEPWVWVPPESIPDWLPQKIGKAYSNMDRRQKEATETLRGKGD